MTIPVIIKKIESPHQEDSFTRFQPLSPDMVREINAHVRTMIDDLGGAGLLKSSRDVYIKPNGVDAKAYSHTRPEVLEALITCMKDLEE